jgi:hypothetical protein
MSNLVQTKSWHKGFRFMKTTHGGPPEMDHLPVAASQTIVEGDPLTLSSGVLSLATAASTEIAGVAAGNVTTTAADEATDLLYYKSTPGNIFVARGDAATSTINEGAKPGIRTSGGYWYIDIGDDNATNIANVMGKMPGDDETDATYYGRIYFVWNRTPWVQTNS